MGELLLEGAIFKKRRLKKFILIGVDVTLILFAYLFALVFRYNMAGTAISDTLELMGKFKWQILLAIVIFLSCQWLMNQYRSIWTLAGIEDFTLGVLSFVGGTVINLMISLMMAVRIPLIVSLLAGILAMVLCNGVRIQWRLIRRLLVAR